QTADRQREMPVGARKILAPERDACVPIGVPAVIPIERPRRKHQAGKCPFRLFLIVRRQGNLTEPVLHTGEFAERALEGVQHADACQTTRGAYESLPAM